MIGSPKLLCADDSIKIYTSSLLSNEHVVSQALSLNDPASLQRMQVPCRSFDCHHLQCFDFSVIVSLNKDCGVEGSFFKCSVCNERRNPNKIYVDFVALGLLRLYKTSDSFKLYRDGTLQTSGSISPDFANSTINSIFDIKRLSILECFQSTAITIGQLHYTSVYDIVDYINKSSTVKLLGLISRYGKTTAKKDAEISLCIEKLRPFYATTLSELQHTFRLISGVGEKKSVKIMTDLVKEYEAESYEHLKRITCGPLDAQESVKLFTEPIEYDVKKSEGGNIMVDLCDDDDDDEIQNTVPLSIQNQILSITPIDISSTTDTINRLSSTVAARNSQDTLHLQTQTNVTDPRQYRNGTGIASSSNNATSSSNQSSQARPANPSATALKPKANRVVPRMPSVPSAHNDPTQPIQPSRIGIGKNKNNNYNNKNSNNNGSSSSSSSNSRPLNDNRPPNNNNCASSSSSSRPSAPHTTSHVHSIPAHTLSSQQLLDSIFEGTSNSSHSGDQGVMLQANAFSSGVGHSSAMSAEGPVTKKAEVIMNPFQALSGMDPKKGCTNSYSCSRPKPTSHLPGGLSNTRVIRGEKVSTQHGASSGVNRSHAIKETLDLPSGTSNVLSEKHLDLTLRDVLKTLPAGDVTLIVLRYLSAHLPAIGTEKHYSKENECTSSGTNSVTIDKNTFVSTVLCAGAGVVSVSDDVDGVAVSRKRKCPITVLQSNNNDNSLGTEDVLEVEVEAGTEALQEVQLDVPRTELECDSDALSNIPVSYWTATNSPEKIRFERNPAYTDIAKNVRDNVRDDVRAVSVALPVCDRYSTSAVENEVSMYMNMEAMEAHNISESMVVSMNEKMDCNNDEGEGFEINSNYSTCSNSSEDKNGHNSHILTEMTIEPEPICQSEEVLNDEECCIIQTDLTVNTVISDLADTCQAVSTSHDCDSTITNHSAATLSDDKVLNSITAHNNEHERSRDTRTRTDIDTDLTLNVPGNIDLINITEKSADSECRIVESVVTTVSDPTLPVPEMLTRNKDVQESAVINPLLILDSQVNNDDIEILSTVIPISSSISSLFPTSIPTSIPPSISATIPSPVSFVPSSNGMTELLNLGTGCASRVESSVPLGLFQPKDTIDMIDTTAPLLCSDKGIMPPTDTITDERDVVLIENDKVICNAVPVGNGQDRVSTATVNSRLDLTVEDSTRDSSSCTQPVTSEFIPLLTPRPTIGENEKVKESDTANHTVLKSIEEGNTVKAVMPLRGSEVPAVIKEKCSTRETISMMVRRMDKGSAPQASFISSSFKNVQRKTPLNTTSSVHSTQTATTSLSVPATTVAAAASAATITTTTAASATTAVAATSNPISLSNPIYHEEPWVLTPWLPFKSPSSLPLPSSSSSSSSSFSFSPSSSSSLPSASSSSSSTSSSSSSSSSSPSSSSSSPRLSITLPTPSLGANSVSLLPDNTKEPPLLSKMSVLPSFIEQQSRSTSSSINKDKVVANMDSLSDPNRYHSAREPSYYDNNDQDHTGTTDSEMINDSNDSSMILKKGHVVCAAPLNALLDVVRHSDSVAPPTKKLKSSGTSTDTTTIPCNTDIHYDGSTGDNGNGNGKKRPLFDNTQSGTKAEVPKKVQNVQNGPLHIPEKKKGISVWALNLARTTQKTDLRLVRNKKKISHKKMEQWLRAVAYLKTKNHYTPTEPEEVTPSVVTSHVPCPFNTVQPWKCLMCNHMMSVRSTNCSRCNHVCTHVTTPQPTGVLSVPQGTRVYPKPLTAHAKVGSQRVSALAHEKPPDRPSLEKPSQKPFERPIEKNQSSQHGRGSSQFTAIDDVGKNKSARIDNSEYICRSVEVHIPTERMIPRSSDVSIVSKIPKVSSSSSSSSSSNLSAKNAAHLATMHAAATAAAVSSKGPSASRPVNSVSTASSPSSSSSAFSLSSGSSSRKTAPAPSSSTSSSSLTLAPAPIEVASKTATATATGASTSSKTSSSTATLSSSTLIPAPPIISSVTSSSGRSSQSFIDLTIDDDEPCIVRKVHTTKQLENTNPARTQQQRTSEPTSSSTHTNNSNNGNQKKRSHPSAFDNDVSTSSSNTATKNKHPKSSEAAPKVQNHAPKVPSPRNDRGRPTPQAFPPPPPPTFSSSSSFVPTSSRGSSSSSSYNGSATSGAVYTGQAPRPFQPPPPPPPYPPMPRYFQNHSESLKAPPSDKTNQNTRFCRRSIPLAKGNHSLQSIDSPESFNKLNVDDFSTG